MKLLTLNTYSWVQTADPETYAALIADILENEYDAIALQEVNQLSSGTSVNEPEGYLPTQNEIPIKSDNFAYFLVKSLAEKGLSYHWSWVPCHQGYFRFDEGVAILSKAPIQSVEQVQLSVVNDFENIHTRRALALETEAAAFVSVHLSWWKTEEENPFLLEWTSVETAVKKLRGIKPIYVMGDFNNPSRRPQRRLRPDHERRLAGCLRRRCNAYWICDCSAGDRRLGRKRSPAAHRLHLLRPAASG